MASLADVVVLPPASSPWWVIAGAALPSVASGIWVVYRYYAERRTHSDEAELSADERKMVEFEKQRASFTKIQEEFFDKLRTENAELRKDRDRGWNLFREIETRAHGLFHALANARTIIVSLQIQLGMTPSEWPPEPKLPTDQGDD